jgi:hypothetical protein
MYQTARREIYSRFRIVHLRRKKAARYALSAVFMRREESGIMKRNYVPAALLTALLLLSAAAAPADKEIVVKHVRVYYEQGRFGGWPANYGIWSWGNEILTGFSRGWYRDLGPDRHHIDREKPEEHWLARSLDGGDTWALENPAEKGFLIPEGGALHGTELEGVEIPEWKLSPGGIDFTHPDFAMTLRMTDINSGPSRFYYSYDRGHTWEGPFRLPLLADRGTAARTDYIVDGQHECMVFLTASKSNGREGRPFCARTTDGGKSWAFVSWIGPEPMGFAIMPATVRLDENRLLTVVRCRRGPDRWLSAWHSGDNGYTWEHRNNPVPDTGEGNPPALIRLASGKLCLTYGYRAEPYSIQALLSNDEGRTWSDPVILRDDGNDRDIGYPRSVQRPDGKVVTLYYFNDAKTGPERYIAATIWDPEAVPLDSAGETQGPAR